MKVEVTEKKKRGRPSLKKEIDLEKVLEIAIKSFANEGYKGVPTSKIARQASVSEGLIFKHFTNKEGLLEAIMNLAVEKTEVLFKPIIVENNPKRAIEKAITLPFGVKKSEYNFWKLQFKLKWEMEYSSTQKMKPFIDKLSWAFTELNYKDPKAEAEVLNHIIDSVAGGILKEGLESQEGLKDFLLDKYKI